MLNSGDSFPINVVHVHIHIRTVNLEKVVHETYTHAECILKNTYIYMGYYKIFIALYTMGGGRFFKKSKVFHAKKCDIN